MTIFSELDKTLPPVFYYSSFESTKLEVIICCQVMECLIPNVIIWHGGPEVNPSILIGSFLVMSLPYGPLHWKLLKPCIFFFFCLCLLIT